MENISIIFLSIVILFFLLMGVKELLTKKMKNKFCVICATITLTWLALLILLWLNVFNNKIIIALLMGQTILGVFYMVESKVQNKLKLFRLPFILTLIFIAYFLLSDFSFHIETVSILIIVWAFFLFIYSIKTNDAMYSLVNKIIECCKKW